MNAREKYIAQYKADHPEYTINLVDMIAAIPAFKDLDSLKFILRESNEILHNYYISGDMIREPFRQFIEFAEKFNRVKNDKRITIKRLESYSIFGRISELEKLIEDILSESEKSKNK